MGSNTREGEGRALRLRLVSLGALSITGCALSPSVNILGSFFPAWLICIVVGVVLTVLTRQVFVATGIAPDVGPAALVYPCLAGVWIFATWLLVFAG